MSDNSAGADVEEEKPVDYDGSADQRPDPKLRKACHIPDAAKSTGEPTPSDREAILLAAGPHRKKIYEVVRQILDDLERAAPWQELYKPSQDRAGLVALEAALLETIDGIPERIQALTAGLRTTELDEPSPQLLSDMEFFFRGIHVSVESDVANLRSKLEAGGPADGPVGLTAEEHDFTCEITADIKGKYVSSMMGAAASLVAEGLWDGVEIEPVLFPEKANEFERNELLVATLNEVIENITNLLEEVPLAEMVKMWGREERVDLYALTPLFSFLGNLGKLMKERSRRALYSGDYHQIQKRERLLNTRINELTTLHNMTWATESKPVMSDGRSPFPVMIRRATELAAILDIGILRKIIGDKHVKDLLAIVTIEKEQAARSPSDAACSSMRASLPEDLHPLILLLYGEDLQNFLGLLLGSVLKRSSLALRPVRPIVLEELRVHEALAEPADAAELVFGDEPADAAEVVFGDEPADALSRQLDDEMLAPLPADLEAEPVPVPAPVPAAPTAPAADSQAAVKLETLEKLQRLLQALLARSNSHRRSFEIVFRLLKQGRTVPPAMLQSMHPYLFEIMNTLIPQLHDIDYPADISANHAGRLFEYCTFLCDRNLDREQIRSEVPVTMERVLRLLDGLLSVTSSALRNLRG